MNPIKTGASEVNWGVAISNQKDTLKPVVDHNFIGQDGFVKEGVTTYEAIASFLKKEGGLNDPEFKILALRANFEKNDQYKDIVADVFQVDGQDYIKFNVEWEGSVRSSDEGTLFKFNQTLYTTVKMPSNEKEIDQALKKAYEGAKCYELSQMKLISRSDSQKDHEQIEKLKHEGTIFFKPQPPLKKATKQEVTPSRTYFKATIQDSVSGKCPTTEKTKKATFVLFSPQGEQKIVLRSSLLHLVPPAITVQKPKMKEKQKEQIEKKRKENSLLKVDQHLVTFQKTNENLFSRLNISIQLLKKAEAIESLADIMEIKPALHELNEDILYAEVKLETSLLSEEQKNKLAKELSDLKSHSDRLNKIIENKYSKNQLDKEL